MANDKQETGGTAASGAPGTAAPPPTGAEAKQEEVEVVVLKPIHYVTYEGKTPVERTLQPARTETQLKRERGFKEARPVKVQLPADRITVPARTAAGWKKLGLAVPAADHKPEVAA